MAQGSDLRIGGNRLKVERVEVGEELAIGEAEIVLGLLEAQLRLLHPAARRAPGPDGNVQLGLDHRPNVAVAFGVVEGEFVGIDAEEVIGG